MNTYKFTIGDTSYEVKADTLSDALTKANGTLPLPTNFYGWFDNGPNSYYASEGAWD